MNCVLFAKMDQVFSLKNKTLKNTGKMEEDTGKVRELWEPWDSFPNGYCVHVRDGSPSQGQISVPIPYI